MHNFQFKFKKLNLQDAVAIYNAKCSELIWITIQQCASAFTHTSAPIFDNSFKNLTQSQNRAHAMNARLGIHRGNMLHYVDFTNCSVERTVLSCFVMKSI